MALYLSFKEIWRNKGRFFLFSLVIALITTLVLFIAALSEGLAQANRQYLEKLNAELLIFQKNVELSPSTSRIDFTKMNDIRRVEGVEQVGPLGFSNGTIVDPQGNKVLDVSLIGVEANKPGAPPILSGRDWTIDRGSETVIDANVANRSGIKVGDAIRLKTIQDSKEQFYNLQVIGLTDGREYMFQPSIFVPYRTWDQIRPQGVVPAQLVNAVSNVVAVKIKPGENMNTVKGRIDSQVQNVEAADIKTAYESLPGYKAQQSTLNTQKTFTLLIGVLVIGGFFQIQMLQKIPQIGVLKAIGASNKTVGLAVVSQIIIITTFGVLLGSLATFALSIGIPSSVPVVFSGSQVTVSILTLLLIGPLGGLVSVRAAVRVEPLLALGLSS